MIYKRLSRNELLKALQDHTRIFNDSAEIVWNDDVGYYIMRSRGSTIFISKFGMNESLPEMITMYQQMNILALNRPIDVMFGGISSNEWMAEIPEEGDE